MGAGSESDWIPAVAIPTLKLHLEAAAPGAPIDPAASARGRPKLSGEGEEEDDEDDGAGPGERTLFVFVADNLVRGACRRVAQSFAFQALVYAAILFSCVLLALAPPIEDLPGQTGARFPPELLQPVDTAITAVFSLEFIVCIVSQVPRSLTLLPEIFAGLRAPPCTP
jgi:hypothetical protein